MRRRLAALALLPALLLSSGAQAAPSPDPVGDLIMSVVTGALPSGPGWNLKATLYHAWARWTRWAARSWPCAPSPSTAA